MTDEIFMHRCLQLARLGAGYTAPNPMVGVILVNKGKIIGEGWHEKYGEAHAEVNCIRAAIANGYAEALSHSTMYVSLEPCAHFGKTPPCSDLIIHYQIPEVVVGCSDPFKEVNGRGIEKLRAAGIQVKVGILEKESRSLNKRFFIFHEQQRPYIILKWAETADGFLATSPKPSPEERAFEYSQSQRLRISNEYTNRLVHKWRSEEASILVGTTTALLDDPELTNRYWTGPSPVRLVLDMNLRLPLSMKIFNQALPTIVFNSKIHFDQAEWPPASSIVEKIGMRSLYWRLSGDGSLIRQILQALWQLKIQSVIVEGGASLLQSFIDEGAWDEARIIKNEELIINNGLAAPTLVHTLKTAEQVILSDRITTYQAIR